MKQKFDVFTADLFSAPVPPDLRDRLDWWLHSDRAELRRDQQWQVVYQHLCAAAFAINTLTNNVGRRAAGVVSQRAAAAPAPAGTALGIYGENGVTFGPVHRVCRVQEST